jgi:hypothetical protein
MALHPIPSAARRLSPEGPHTAVSQPVLPARAPTDSLAAALGSPPQAEGVVGLTYAAPPAAAPATALPSQSLTTHFSDLLLSAVVPAGLPKSTPASASAGPRKLSSRKEELNLTSTTGNFRKFVLKIGVVFWLQDRIEEVFTWRKPAWSVCFALAWALIGRSPSLAWSP